MRDNTKTKRIMIASLFNNILIGVMAGLLAALITFIIISILHVPDKLALQIGIPLVIVVGALVSWLIQKSPLLLSKVAVFLLFSFGVLVILSAYRLEMWADIPWSIRVVGLGTGLISISIGFLALYVSRRSDERMQVMANLEFYEKIAVVENYIAFVKAGQNVVAEAIYNDIKGAMQLKKYVKPEIEQELNNKISELVNTALQGQPYENLVKRLQELQQEDC